MPDRPNLIRVERHGETARVYVDGHEFPYDIARDGIDITCHPDEAPRVRLTLLANQVELDDRLFSRD